MSFPQSVINSLHMTEEDLAMFTPPKACYSSYSRRVIYDINKYQMDLFLNIVNFAPEDHTLLPRKKSLIMFLDQHPEFQDVSYIHIWFRLADEYITRNHRKINIPHLVFEKACRNPTASTKMSFFQKNTLGSKQARRSIPIYEYIEDEEYEEEDSEDSEESDPSYQPRYICKMDDPEIQDLIASFQNFDI